MKSFREEIEKVAIDYAGAVCPEVDKLNAIAAYAAVLILKFMKENSHTMEGTVDMIKKTESYIEGNK